MTTAAVTISDLVDYLGQLEPSTLVFATDADYDNYASEHPDEDFPTCILEHIAVNFPQPEPTSDDDEIRMDGRWKHRQAA
ncbi:MAG: hypothetical protein ACOH1Y_11720 [Propionicimonas sp.]